MSITTPTKAIDDFVMALDAAGMGGKVPVGPLFPAFEGDPSTVAQVCVTEDNYWLFDLWFCDIWVGRCEIIRQANAYHVEFLQSIAIGA